MSAAPSLTFSAGDSPPESFLERIAKARFLPIDKDERWIAFTQQPTGKLLLLIAFGLLLMPATYLWLPITLAIAASSFAGRYRPALMTVGTLLVLICDPRWFDISGVLILEANKNRIHILWLRILALALITIFTGLSINLVRSYKSSRLARRPVISLLGAFSLFVLIAASGVLNGSAQIMLWAFLSAFSAYFWFLCYALIDQKSKDGASFAFQLGTFHPFWGSSTTPIGKGDAYLRKVDSDSPREVAITQLKGLKLLLWSFMLRALAIALSVIVLKKLDIPEFRTAFARQMAGAPYPWYLCWASLIYLFFQSMLALAIWGHVIVASARMAGYRMLRNTCRPLQSKTLAEFWNRYYYYFKELLVDLFFYPTFLRYLKKYPRLRLPFATFVAACVGNMIFHFVRDVGYVAQMGLWKAIVGYQTYAFYCFVLGAGIAVSQLRQRKRIVHEGWIRRRLLPGFCVAGFFCVLQVFNDTERVYTLGNHFTFFFRLFGVKL